MELNQKEILVLEQFRHQVEEVIHDAEDHFLIRWLRARNLDLKKAQEMLFNYFEWLRKNKNLPVIPDWSPPKPVVDDFRYRFLGEDFEGRPIIWMPIGRYWVKRLLEQGLKEDCFRYAYQILDELLAEIERARLKSNVTKFIGLLDMEELALRKFSFDALQSTVQIFREIEAYYPEIIHAVYVINAPYVFSIAFNMVKPIMSSHTLSKIQVFDFNRNKWEQVLKQEIPDDVIPVEYGGSGPAVLS